MTVARAEDMTSVGGVSDRIVALEQQLARLDDLEPGAETNRIFERLVDACAYRPGQDAGAVLADPRVGACAPRLRALCADGEFRLERHWAERILASRDPDGELASFPYLDNYRRLTALELHTLTGVGLDRGRLRRACVLGSGPLPLSALLMARELAVPVDAVDIDLEATDLAGAVALRVADGRRIRTYQADAAHHPGAADADLVLLAALVGADAAAKREVITAVARRMRPGAFLLIRSAHRLRTLLYPPVDPADVAGVEGLTPLAEVHPLDDVVNSVIVAVRS